MQISLRRRRGGEEDVVIKIFNESGALVEEISDPELVDFVERPYVMLKELYHRARGRAMGVDKAVEAIMKELTKDEIPF